ncbi:MAG: helix-turn-helix domain-containing protein [Micrococcales bacterium]|nr:helix-turn-helix domain-containing protein [Micrococcales bacterium]
MGSSAPRLTIFETADGDLKPSSRCTCAVSSSSSSFIVLDHRTLCDLAQGCDLAVLQAGTTLCENRPMTITQTMPDRFAFTLGDRMKRAMKVAGVSRGEMADYLDVEPTTVSTWMNDRVQPGVQTLRLWALKTGAPYEWLVTGKYTPRDLNPEPTD